MAEALARGITVLVPMAHVADVQRTVDFYKSMGLEVRGSLRNSAGDLQLGLLGGIASQQAVLFLSLLARSDCTHSVNICWPAA